MPNNRTVQQLVNDFCQQRPIRAGSLIITVYGDAIAPRGGTVWLGSLINLLEPLGLNQRLVRTSVFRLAKEEWLNAEQIGRRSYYSLTGAGRRRFEKAFKRVYAPVIPDWDGRWCIVLTNQIEAETKKNVKEELGWLGFGNIAPGVLAHPMADMTELKTTLKDLNALDDAIIFDTYKQDLLNGKPLRLLVRDCWNLDQLSESYKLFLNKFRPVWNELKSADQLDPEDCFLVRTLLIHEYRRVLLRDPQLPEELLPSDWEGTSARLLCRNLYRLVTEKTELHLSSSLETAEGPLPDASAAFYKRFGGL
ncbi:transcriptional regulator, PaaX family [Oceanospirillum multiglobuliferum]|uniref:Phenylacetic acid degradation operon negative regulatory protein PaaX n=1 Tax=Oceanospirillum multiglobuliferum TaxID=64969 RepID=A0A1T4RWT8_9GAMM|nr:phenylacetic acid degradation operon negative regulatory protein PaaX [Oceanospirillum multiglobuliferum]OPX54581.1 phenylacetic acid degradation operon negative regulatory protein PaaX [Oceanospirillum multiglobuliferum]SKA20433.1 transcriptional regulator, PaaX family [Oceanospirillum multiglobuliferum]